LTPGRTHDRRIGGRLEAPADAGPAPATSHESAAAGAVRRATATRALLACGVLAGPLFTAAWLLEGARRADYDPVRHPISSRAFGERGWTQRASFVAAGLLLNRDERGWAACSATTGGAFLPVSVLTSLPFGQVEWLVAHGGLLQRATLSVGWTWLALLGAHLLKEDRRVAPAGGAHDARPRRRSLPRLRRPDRPVVPWPGG
jgi:hypothetical protein